MIPGHPPVISFPSVVAMPEKRYRKKPENQYEWVNAVDAAKALLPKGKNPKIAGKRYLYGLRKEGSPYGMPRRIVANNIIHKLWRNVAAKDKKPILQWNVDAIAMWMDNEYEKALFDEEASQSRSAA